MPQHLYSVLYIFHVNQSPLKPDPLQDGMGWKKSLLNKDDLDQADSRELESESKYGVNHWTYAELSRVLDSVR